MGEQLRQKAGRLISPQFKKKKNNLMPCSALGKLIVRNVIHNLEKEEEYKRMTTYFVKTSLLQAPH